MSLEFEEDYYIGDGMQKYLEDSGFYADIPSDITNGETFLVLDEDAKIYKPIKCMVDPLGMFFVMGIDDGLCVDLVHALEVRYRSVPSIANQGNSNDFDAHDLAFSITYGEHLFPKRFVYLIAKTQEKAMYWVRWLCRLVNSTRLINPSFSLLIAREFYRLQTIGRCVGKLNLKSLLDSLRCGKNDKYFIQTLHSINLIDSSQSTIINLNNFTVKNIFKFFAYCQRGLFLDLIRLTMMKNDLPYIPFQEFKLFIESHQCDDFTSSYYENPERIYNECETSVSYKSQKILSNDGILNYIFSPFISAVHCMYDKGSDDMSHPISHYFIKSSHNTYLSGRQVYANSTLDMYRVTLLSGCRCVELDCWDGPDDEPIITHGKALCTNISFRETLITIKETAFIKSPYPVILSLENHCGLKQQLKMSQYMREIFGNDLLAEPLLDYPLKPGVLFPSPEDLRGKILVKNKKLSEKNEALALKRLRDVSNSSESFEQRRNNSEHPITALSKLTSRTSISMGVSNDNFSTVPPKSSCNENETSEILRKKDCFSVDNDVIAGAGEVQSKTLADVKILEKKKKRRISIFKKPNTENQGTEKKERFSKDKNARDSFDGFNIYNTFNTKSKIVEEVVNTPSTGFVKKKSRLSIGTKNDKDPKKKNYIISIFKKASKEGKTEEAESFSMASSVTVSTSSDKKNEKMRIKSQISKVEQTDSFKRTNSIIGGEKIEIGDPTNFRELNTEVTLEEAKMGKDIYIEPNTILREKNSKYSINKTKIGELEQRCSVFSTEDKSSDNNEAEKTEENNNAEKGTDLACQNNLQNGDMWDDLDASFDEEDDSLYDEVELEETQKAEGKKRYKIHPLLSVLVNYIKPAPIYRFNRKATEEAEYHLKITSLNESSAERYIKEHQAQIVLYTQKSLLRIYPKAKRIDSSNFNPQPYWNAGCQMAALNYQTDDIPMQVNFARFEANNRCGYVLKPLFLLEDGNFNPIELRSPHDIKTIQLKLTIISAMYVVEGYRPDLFCTVETFGKMSESKYRKVKAIESTVNGVNFESEKISFDSINSREYTYIRFALVEKHMCFGQRILCVKSLRKGYRYIPLRNSANQQLPLGMLFVYVDIIKANR